MKRDGKYDALVIERAATGADSEEAIGRLVETFEAEMWGGQVPVVDLIATYEHA